MTAEDLEAGPGPHRQPLPPRALGVPALLVLVAVFLALELPAYVGFGPAASRVPVRPELPLHYPLLVAHIMSGSIALVTA